MFPDRTKIVQEQNEAQRQAELAAQAAREAELIKQAEIPVVIQSPVIEPGNGNGYSFGQCTYYVAMRRGVPGGWGNAANWFYAAQASGFPTGTVPRPGAIGVEKGINHVVYIESVAGDMVLVSEMNYAGWNVVSQRSTSASNFLYIY